MSDNNFSLTPLHVVGAISIEAKQLAILIDSAATKGTTIDLDAVNGAIQRMRQLASAVQPAGPADPVPTENPAGE